MQIKVRAMISQPMAGKTKEEILKEREEAVKWLESIGYEVVDTVFNFSNEKLEKEDVLFNSVYYLAASIKEMSKCNLVYFCKGWQNARGCKIEFEIAKEYGIQVIAK